MATAATKKAAIAFARWSARRTGRDAACRALGLSPRTLTSWNKQRTKGTLTVSRGRPPRRASPEELDAIDVYWEAMGATLGAPLVQRALPGVAKREISTLLAQKREAAISSGRVELTRLAWNKPGRVWAMDFTAPPSPIDGVYPNILAVRDLGSPYQIAALPTLNQCTETVVDALAALFAEHGAPLVLKSDNGPSFLDRRLREFLSQHRIDLLLSPVRRPTYNGACEAGIGGLKTRAHHVAARHGRPRDWTCDDVESARLQGNAAPQHPRLLTCAELWERRSAITIEERDLYWWTRARRREEHPDATERAITRGTLEDLGILSIRRRRFTLRINPGFAAANS